MIIVCKMKYVLSCSIGFLKCFYFLSAAMGLTEGYL